MTPENKDTQSATPGDAEAALRECDANLHAFFSSMADIVLAVARDGRLLFANAAATRLLGYAPDELGAMHLLDLHPADGRGEAGEIFAAMLNGGRTSAFLTLARKDGGLVPVETRAWLGRWNGEACLFGIARNLSAEQEAQQRFERLFRNSPALMAFSSLPDQRFVDVNDAFLKTLGYARAEVIGKTVAELGSFPQAEQQAALAVKLQAEGRLAGVSLQVRRKDGAVLDGLFSAEVIDIHGRPHFLTTMTDITARKQAEEVLREKTALLTGLLASIPDIIFFKNPAGVYLGCNSEFARLVGRDVPGVVGASDHDLFGAETADFFRAQDRLMMDRGVPRHNEEWIQYPDGARILIDTLKAPLRDADGQVIGLLGVSRDITARKQAEEALQASEARYQALFDWASDGILILSCGGGILSANESFARMHGFSRQEILGMRLEDLNTPASLRQIPGWIRRVLAGEILMVEVDHYHKDGHVFRLEVSASSVESGKDVFIQCFHRDITARRQAEAALRMSEARLREVLENSQDASYKRDLQSSAYAYLSPTFAGISGYTPDEMNGLPMDAVLGLIHPDDLAEVQRVIAASMVGAAGAANGVEYRFKTKAGPYRWIQDRFTIMPGADGKPLAMIGSVRDITARRQVEDALRKSAADLHALSARLQAVREEERTAISRELHDSLGQHLTSFQVELMWMDRHLQTARPPDLGELYDRIVALEPLVERLTEQTQAICSSLRSSVLDELGLAAAIEWQAQDTAKRTGLVCTVSLPCDVALEKDVALALFRIMQEALTNVVRHAQATHVAVSLHAAAGALELEIRDDGRGFAPGTISGPGAIGLLGMRERAGVFGGTVDFLGGPGQGATVRVRMPVGVKGAGP
jgi:PAS domain S-box-containing protein